MVSKFLFQISKKEINARNTMVRLIECTTFPSDYCVAHSVSISECDSSGSINFEWNILMCFNVSLMVTYSMISALERFSMTKLLLYNVCFIKVVSDCWIFWKYLNGKLFQCDIFPCLCIKQFFLSTELHLYTWIASLIQDMLPNNSSKKCCLHVCELYKFFPSERV